jgi:hypothetical protein
MKENLINEILLNVKKPPDSEIIGREILKIEWSLELLCSARFLFARIAGAYCWGGLLGRIAGADCWRMELWWPGN